MMHLWGRVYIDYDFNISETQDRFVISTANGHPFARDISEVGYLTLHTHGLSLTDLIGQDKKYASMAALLADAHRVQEERNKSVVIYCDKPAFIEIATLWLKTILPNATAETIKEILTLYTAKEKAISGFVYTGVSRIDRIWNVDADADAVIDSSLLKDIGPEFDAFFEVIKTTISIEYLLPTFLSGDTRYDRPFLDSMYNLLSRKAVNEVYDWRNFICTNIQTTLVKQMFNVPDGAYDLESVPSLEPLVNPRFWNRTGLMHPNSSNPALLLTEMSMEDAQSLVTLLTSLRDPYASGPAKPIVMTEVMVLDLIPLLTKGRLLAVEARDVLEHPSFTAISLWSGQEIMKVNFYLVDKILQSDPADLVQYCLR